MIHSMVEFRDGSTIAQMDLTADARAHRPRPVLARAAPGHRRAVRLDAGAIWDFSPLDDEAFPAVRLARRVGAAGGTYPAVYNAANEVGVDAFRDGQIGFLDIVDTVARVVDEHQGVKISGTER